MHENSEARRRGFECNYDSEVMHRIFAGLLALLLFTSGPVMGENAGFRQSCLAAEETAVLKPYGGPGGGHHLPAKSAFEGAPGYDLNQALAVPNAELARLGVNHGLVSGAQQTLYRAFAQTGAPLTWEAAARIETQALARGGMNPGMAQATVAKAIEGLKGAGVPGPTRIPWGN